jgi:hypothetical protein
MQEFLNCLDQYNSLLTLLFTGVVAVSTVIYAGLTWSLVSETRAMRQVYTDPKIDFTIRPQYPHFGILNARVQNIGQGPAYNIRFEIEQISNGTTTETTLTLLKSNQFISKGINYLSPSQYMDTFLEGMYENTKEKFDIKFNVYITYETASGDPLKDFYHVEFSEHEGGALVNNDHIYHSSKHLEKISMNIEKIVESLENMLTKRSS